jgi:hypothetical protein
MPADAYDDLKDRLEQKKEELTIRLERIKANLRRGYHADSKERAKELEDSEVVDALGAPASSAARRSNAAGSRPIRTPVNVSIVPG